MLDSITPPPELVDQWVDMLGHRSDHEVFAAAAQWGADMELEACCELLKQKGVPAWSLLRLHRRPKPPSLKEQALRELEEIMNELHEETGSAFTATAIRRALEALPDD